MKPEKTITISLVEYIATILLLVCLFIALVGIRYEIHELDRDYVLVKKSDLAKKSDPRR